jgi:hypothetical protein
MRIFLKIHKKTVNSIFDLAICKSIIVFSLLICSSKLYASDIANGKVITLTPNEIQKLLDVRARYAGSQIPPPKLADTSGSRPHLHVFVAAFDGTFNDRDAVPPGERATLVADIQRDLKDTDTLKSHYYEGVGTRTIPIIREIEGAFGIGCEERAERAYKDLQKQVEQWQIEDPLVEVHVHVIGFSRGGASALHFLNLIDERGVVPLQRNTLESKPVPTALLPGHIFSSATLLDTVVTGQEQVLKLTLPGSTKSALQITAEHEIRRAFSLTTIQDPTTGSGYVRSTGFLTQPKSNWNSMQVNNGTLEIIPRALPNARNSDGQYVTNGDTYTRVITVTLPGAHSDIGGAYIDGNIREMSKYIIDQYHMDLGLPSTPIRPSTEHVLASFAHDSRWPPDKFIDAVMGNHVRDVRESVATGWDGTLREQMTIHTGDGTIIFGGERAKPSAELTNDKAIFTKHVLTLFLDNAGVLHLASSRPGAFSYDKNKDKVLFLGEPIEHLGGREDIAKHLIPGGLPTIFEITPSKYFPDLVENAGEIKIDSQRRFHSFATPEAALQDLLTYGLQYLGKDALPLSFPEAKNLVQKISSAMPREHLVITKHGIFLCQPNACKAGSDELVLDIENLRQAIGISKMPEIPVRSAYESIQTTESTLPKQ